MATMPLPTFPADLKVTSSSSLILIGLALLAGLLGIYQWVELVQVRSGGEAPVCSLNEMINCVGVWDSALAHKVHAITTVPLAGWGLAWSLVILLLAIALFLRRRALKPVNNIAAALRVTAGVGVAVSLLLLLYSISIGIFCPTCIIFYLLVAAVAYVVFLRLKTHETDWAMAGLLSTGLLIVALGVLIYPGLNTPRESLIVANIIPEPVQTDPPAAGTEVEPPAAAPANPLEAFLISLPTQVQQFTSDTLAVYRRTPVVAQEVDPRRLIYGTPEAPVHLTEWTDIKCPHCKTLEESLRQISAGSPPGSWSEEARHYPLDSECNGNMQRSAGGVSCLAAKLQICLIGSPYFQTVRSGMFSEQSSLTKERIWEIAEQNGGNRAALESCVASSATEAALQEDITLAEKYQLEGTPLVVINNRKATALPSLIYGLIIAKGNDEDPGFLTLPTPDVSLPE